MRVGTLAAAVALGLQAASTPTAPTVPTKDVKRYVGKDVNVCGRAVNYECDDKNGSLRLHLDTQPSNPGVSVVIPRQFWPDTRGRQITDTFLLSSVCARGTLRKEAARHLVVFNATDQLQRVGGAPPPAPPFAPDAMQTCAEGVTPPLLVKEVKPQYT